MNLEAKIIDTDYEIEDDEVVLRLFGVTEEGKNFVAEDRDFLPYFYAVPQENIEELKEALDEEVITDDDGEELEIVKKEVVEKKDGKDQVKVLKIYSTVPPNIPKLKDEIKRLEAVSHCREFDIPFYKRYLIDNQILPTKKVVISGEKEDSDNLDFKVNLENVEAVENEGDINFTKIAFDLEVIDDEVIMASFYSDDFEKVLSTKEVDREYVEVLDGEKKLLERLIEILTERDVDILTGYNTDEFDFKILRGRVQEYNMELSLGRNGERMKFKRRGRFSSARLKGRMHLDLYPFITHILAPGLDSETLDLDSVAEEMLGEGKDDVEFAEMREWWVDEENLGKFVDYALKDSRLAYELSEEIVPQIIQISQITGLIPFDACRLTYGQLTENFLLKESYKRGILAPNRPTRNERRRRRNQGAYEGGFVYTPESGLHENISVFDFRSLYPTVMVAHNISPEVLDLEGCNDKFSPEDFDFYFCQDEQGFFPELIEGLVKSRYEIKEKMNEIKDDSRDYERMYNQQQAQKILANSFYGYLGYDGARWYSKESAQATTFMGRKYIEDTIEIAEDSGFEIVYGDTDSVFIKGESVEEKREEFLEKVNDQLPEFMELEFEGHFKTGLFTSKESGEGAKKKYALMSEEGEMKITGFEQVRRDWSPIAKEAQKEVLREVLQKNIEGAVEIAKSTISDLKEGKVDLEKLRIYTTLTKPPEEYDSTSPHVEAARDAIERGDNIKPETTIDYIITRGGGSISDRAKLTKYADSYDADYYVENQVLPAVVRVLKVFGYTEGQLKGKGKQSGLGRFQ